MRSWRVYYGDKTTYASWEQSDSLAWAPSVGVIGIVQSDTDPDDVYATGRELLFDADYYCWRDEDARWFRCDIRGLFDYLATPGWKKVLSGIVVPRAHYKEILGRMVADPDFAVKTAVQSGEERAFA